jgi:hydrogenase maturation protease
MSPAPWLVLAVGNPSRGDDALGPALLERLHDAGVSSDGEVELLADFQLQVEHALDLQGRRGVLFVDAARPCSALATAGGAALTAIVAAAGMVPASHALRAEAVLQVAAQLGGQAPPAWQLAIAGESFALGEGLTVAATRHLDRAVLLAQQWLQVQRAGTAHAAAGR